MTYTLYIGAIVISLAKIGPAIVKGTRRRQTISAGSSAFLIIRLQTLRAAIMDDTSDIGLVDAHPESNCCNHDNHLVCDK